MIIIIPIIKFVLLICLQQQVIRVNAFVSSSYEQYDSELTKLDHRFTKSGPNIQLLQDYEKLLSEIINPLSLSSKNSSLLIDERKIILPKIYYKKGLIDLYLGKETKSIVDFQNCLEYDDSMSIAKIRLMKLYLIHGKYQELELMSLNQLSNPKYQGFFKSNDEIQQVLTDYDIVKEKISNAENFHQLKQYGNCIDSVSDGISISSSNSQLFKLRIQCTIKSALMANNKEKQDDNNQHLRNDLAAALIPDYLLLTQLNPLNIDNYLILSNLYFFGWNEFENAAKHVRKGLHFDMDNKPLKKSSLFFKRNEKLLALITKFKIYNQWLFDKQEVYVEDIDVNYVSNSDYQEILRMLFEDKPNIPSRDVRNIYNGKEFQNNFEFFSYLDDKFNNEFFKVDKDDSSSWKSKLGFGSSSSESNAHIINGLMLDMNKIACESYLFTKKPRIAKPFCNKVLEIEKQNQGFKETNDKTYISSFAPAMVYEIQKLIKEKDLTKLKPYYEKFGDNENLKKIDIFAKVYSKIEKMFAKSQQEQKDRFQQQQQQQQQQQYRQYQQQQNHNSPPKNDYYKTLGVAKDANDRDIKTAYRNLVKKFHPDKYKGDDAEEKMAEINTAYEVLSDEELRKRYDMGDDPNDPAGAGGRSQGGPQRGGFNPFGGQGQGGQGGFQFQFNGDPFSGFNFGGFGGQGGAGGRGNSKRRAQQRRTNSKKKAGGR